MFTSVNPVVMGLQMQICLIICISLSIMVTFCVLLRTSSSKTQMLFLKKNIFQEYWLPCSRFITFTTLLTFDLCGLLSFVCHSYTIGKTILLLCGPIRAPDQIQDRIYVISMEFLLLRRRRSSWRNSLAARNKEKRLYSKVRTDAIKANYTNFRLQKSLLSFRTIGYITRNQFYRGRNSI